MLRMAFGFDVSVIGPFVRNLLLLVVTSSCVLAGSPNVAARTPWTTSRISGAPEPPLPFVTERAFPALKFDQCLDLTTAPGSDRIFVVEQAGKLFSFPNKNDVKSADLVIDFAKEISGLQSVYALAFHPNFEQNRYCYICYIKAANLEDGTHVARFTMRDTNPPTIDAASETTLVTWLSGGHNGCCLKFGPDGYFYISTGDGGPANPPDPLKAGQDLGNLLSSILRIDVDHPVDGMNYGIPDDNPFVDREGARGEIWAYGLRNPWRMSFDRQTGDLWVGDVGWEMWEMLYRIERGGNYGWAVMEGRQPTHPEWPRGPTPILPPLIDHPHSESSSITEGLTYYGAQLAGLQGTHIYGDYDTGKFWGFRYENGQVVEHREIADTTHRIVAFGEDYDGEPLFLDHTAGTIHRLIPNRLPDTSGTFPRKLSDTGVFESVAEQTSAPGVIAYSINAEPWADHGVAQRFVAVPDALSINAEGSPWSFPKNSVLVKTLSLDLEMGNPATRRKIETQILHFDGIDWMPYTYQWNREQSDAKLVDAQGAERTYEVIDEQAVGGIRKQVWRFAGRAECQRCHNKWSGPPLAFNTPQLNNESSGRRSQLDTFAEMGLFEKPLALENRVHLANPSDSTASLDDRARAYLQVNCAHCHRQHAGGAVLSKMHFDVPLNETNMIDVRPTQGTFGIHAAQVIAAGDPYRSVLLLRMSKLGGGRMPYIGSNEVDLAGIKLIDDWIRQIPSGNESADSRSASKRHAEMAATLERLGVAHDPTLQSSLVEQLLASTSGALMLLRSIDQDALSESIVTLAVQQATQHQEISVRDLFERFLPSEQRVKRLGSVVELEQILALEGDPARGKQLFFTTSGVSCRNCHRIHEEGKEVGPDLTTIGKKASRAELLESILEPSKRIDPKYVTYLVETADGRVLTGLLVSKDENEIVLRDATNVLIPIPADEVELAVTRQMSLMPELLVRDMTAQQVSDLLAYLGSLK